MKCPTCGANATGKFCAACGASLKASTCEQCGAPLTAGAKFCHGCGAPARGGTATLPTRRPSPVLWFVAGGAVVVLLVVLTVTQLKPGASGSPAPQLPAAGLGQPVDISQLSPKDAADRLFNRVMTAYESGAKDTARFFAPMAVQAYGMVDSLDADARYHIGLIHLVTEDYDGALAEADTIAREVPGHLYAILLRAEVARGRGDTVGLRRAERTFLENYDAETRANRPEYAQHPGLIDRFRSEARQALGQARQ